MSLTATYSDETVSYLRKVYAWLLVGIGIAIGVGYWGLTTGSTVVVIDGVPRTVPESVRIMVEHPFVMCFSYIGVAFIAGRVRKASGLNALVYAFITAMTGIIAGPAIYIAQLKAAQGGTLSAHPVRDAAILTTVAFVSLSAYTLVSGKNFSFLANSLWTGLWVLIGALFLGLFFQSTVYDLAISSVAVLLFSGFILFDTWRVLEDSERDDAIGLALQLFLDLANLFLHLVRIFGASKD